MKKIIFLSMVSLVLNMFSSTQSNAVYNGLPAKGNERVVLIVENTYGKLGCSGSLISPRVVFTAGHCLNTSKFVFPPNAIIGSIDSPDPVKVIKTFSPKEFNTCSNCGRGPIEDFGILILEKDLANVPPMKIATLQEVVNVIESNIDVIQVGYGVKQLAPNHTSTYISTNFPERLISKLRATPFLQNNEDEKNLIANKPNIFVNTLNSPDRTVCGGDSGSPLYYEKDAEYIYIGALSAVTGASCQYSREDPIRNNPYWIDRTFGVYYVAAYYQTTIDLAIDFLRVKLSEESLIPRSVQKSKTVTCVKGKTVKKVRGVNPVCPKGFKKK